MCEPVRADCDIVFERLISTGQCIFWYPVVCSFHRCGIRKRSKVRSNSIIVDGYLFGRRSCSKRIVSDVESEQPSSVPLIGHVGLRASIIILHSLTPLSASNSQQIGSRPPPVNSHPVKNTNQHKKYRSMPATHIVPITNDLRVYRVTKDGEDSGYLPSNSSVCG